MTTEKNNETEQIRQAAEKALRDATEAERNSEYPRLGKAAYTGLSQALGNLAETLEAPPTTPAEDNAFERRRAARIDRLRRRAAHLRVESARLDVRSHDIGRLIPFGQPILVGHHSERGHRNAIEKMHRATRKSIELNKAAERADSAARSAEKNTAVFSDDPNAVNKLTEKLADMETTRERMKAANKLAAKNDAEGLKAMGYTDQQVHRLLNPTYSYEKKGFQGWQLTNLGAEIRRIKERISTLQAPTSNAVEITGEGFKVFEDAEENRICFQFDGKPEEKIRTALKSRGFKWSPSRGLWVRLLNDNARWAAKHAIAEFTK
jgi:hypothetical protein